MHTPKKDPEPSTEKKTKEVKEVRLSPSSMEILHGRPPQTEHGRVWEVLMKATVPVSIIIAASLIRHEVTVSRHDLRINQIESNRFTAADGLRLEKRLQEWIETRFPPNWLRDDISDIRKDLQTLKDAGKNP